MVSKKIHFGFDGATPVQAKNQVENIAQSEKRELQSIEEHARTQALSVVLALIMAVSGDTLGDTLPSDYLDELLLEAIDDLDDEDDANQTAWDLLVSAVSDALESFDVDESMIQEMFNDDVASADSAIEAVTETVIANLPDEGEPLDFFIRKFIFGEDDDDDDVHGFDAGKGRLTKSEAKAKNGAMSVKKFNGKKVVYRGVVAIRKGKRVVVNKRLPNQKVRLTAKQKAGLKKAQLKAHTASAIKKRVLSFLKRKNV